MVNLMGAAGAGAFFAEIFFVAFFVAWALASCAATVVKAAKPRSARAARLSGVVERPNVMSQSLRRWWAADPAPREQQRRIHTVRSVYSPARCSVGCR